MTDTTERLRVEDIETKLDDNGERVSDPQGIVTRWLAEIDLASKTEKNWRNEGSRIWKKYRNESARAQTQAASESSFNILWSNTEIIVPSLYNSTPTPDVRRRFKDSDPVGKTAATVLERGLAYSIDAYDFDHEVQSAVLDFALVGRGGARIRYRPTVDTIDSEPPERSEADSELAAYGDEATETPEASPIEQIVDQETTCEHFQWADFRRGPGKTWREVPWVAFRHDMTYDDLVEYFGEDRANSIPLAQLDESDDGTDDQSRVKRLFQSGEVWEIWDRLKRRVLFISKGAAEPLLIDDDPTLKLRGFLPLPRPMMALEDSTSLIPVPLYRQYESQAEEMDRLTRRIEKISFALRVRGAYSANVKEAPEIMEAGDNEFVAMEDAAGIAAAGGIDKLIWIMPVERLVQVLQGLYTARDQVKQTIYEIIGLSDIMRGATKATETLGAQQLKSRWGSIRLQRLQKEVQRFVRDLMRLKGEVIAEHYEPEVLAQITQLDLPTDEQKGLLQNAVASLQQAGQPVPPEYADTLSSPSWNDVIDVLRSDTMRQYRVNIETDSTVRDLVDSDMQGMSEVLGALGNVFGAVPVLSQAGASNASDTIKEIALAVCRHARMGRTVEDSIENLEFGPGQNELMQAIQQMQQALQQGGQQIQQLMAQAQKHEQIIGQLVKTMGAIPTAQPGGAQ